MDAGYKSYHFLRYPFHQPKSEFLKLPYKIFLMGLFDKSKQNDKKKGGKGAGKSGPNLLKGKSNTKPATRNTKLTGGTNRGS